MGCGRQRVQDSAFARDPRPGARTPWRRRRRDACRRGSCASGDKPLDRAYRRQPGARGDCHGARASARRARAFMAAARRDRQFVLGLGAVRAARLARHARCASGRLRSDACDGSRVLRRTGAAAMVISLGAYLALLAALAAERMFHLALASRNVRRAFAAGAVEHGRGHYPVMVAFHALFLLSAAAEAIVLRRPFPGALGWIAL